MSGSQHARLHSREGRRWKPRCGGHHVLMPVSGALGDDGTVLEIVLLASRDTGEG